MADGNGYLMTRACQRIEYQKQILVTTMVYCMRKWNNTSCNRQTYL